MSKMKRLFPVIVMIFISIGLVFYFFTLQSFQEIETARMKWDGISHVLTPEFDYFEKNNCVEGRSCQCTLLIHGLGDFALTWRKMLSLDKVLFSHNVHMFAVNLPGALSTPKLANSSDYNVQNMAKRVGDYFLPKCESWVVVGNSFGGWMATFMALNNPNIKGLLLLGPAGLKRDYSHVTNYFLNPTVEGARDFYYKIYAQPLNVPDLIFKRVVERLKTQPVLDQLKAIKDEDYVDTYLKQIQIPVFYAWGEADGVIPTEWAQSYQELTPGSHLEVIQGCGHVPQKECTEDVLRSFNALLDRVNESDLRKATNN